MSIRAPKRPDQVAMPRKLIQETIYDAKCKAILRYQTDRLACYLGENEYHMLMSEAGNHQTLDIQNSKRVAGMPIFLVHEEKHFRVVPHD